MINLCTIRIGVSEFIHIFTLFCNILLFIVNIFIVKWNNKIGINKSIELNFYQLTLVKTLKDYFDIIGNINTKYTFLGNEYTQAKDEEAYRNLAEAAIKELDEIYEKCENEFSPYLTGFSPKAKEEIHKIFEKYYDTTTKIFSEYSQPLLNQTKQMKMQKLYSEEKEMFIRCVCWI